VNFAIALDFCARNTARHRFPDTEASAVAASYDALSGAPSPLPQRTHACAHPSARVCRACARPRGIGSALSVALARFVLRDVFACWFAYLCAERLGIAAQLEKRGALAALRARFARAPLRSEASVRLRLNELALN
jgi:hypothetical protein